MVYYTVLILLSKPFLSQPEPVKRRSSTTADDRETAKKAKLLCDESAGKMAAITQKYRQEFGGYRLSPITATYCSLSATLVSLENYSSGEKGSKTEQRSMAQKYEIEAFLQTLKELSTSWIPAKCIHLHLGKLYKRACDKHHDSPIAPGIEAPDCSTHQNSMSLKSWDEAEPLPPLSFPPSSDMDWDILADPHTLHDQTVLPHDLHSIDIDEVFARDLGLSFSAHLPSDYNI